MSLENAPPEIKLAVDLIMLLENNAIEPKVVLAALEIVQRDYRAKAATPSAPEASEAATPSATEASEE